MNINVLLETFVLILFPALAPVRPSATASHALLAGLRVGVGGDGGFAANNFPHPLLEIGDAVRGLLA